MPTVLVVDGHRFFFYSNEATEPAHIHVETAECTAKFWLADPVQLAHANGYTSKQLKRLAEIVNANREAFIGAWDDHFASN
jgi:hypothetical protein